MKASLAACLFLVSAATAASGAPTAPAPTPSPSESANLLPGGTSKEPISIEADKLVYSQKEMKATYTGNVIAIQGPTKIMCSIMTLFLDNANAHPAHPAPEPSSSASSGNSQVRHMDCAGPVTVISKTQVATGDSAAYDRPQNTFVLIGNVSYSDGGNVTKGDKLNYDLVNGGATVESKGAAGKPRVQSQFIPGQSNGK